MTAPAMTICNFEQSVSMRPASSRNALGGLPGTLCLIFSLLFGAEAAAAQKYDLLLRGGTIYDGSGTPGIKADIGIVGDRIAAIGDLSTATATKQLDVRGLAVAPGFINMLSWGAESVIADPRGLSDLMQGVTLQIFGEGWSMGPRKPQQSAPHFPGIEIADYHAAWSTLGGYLDWVERRGVAQNIGSFVGATSVRLYVMGEAPRSATDTELSQMSELVREAMREGAFGVGSSLIYVPSIYADTRELTALARAAAQYGGMYISHMRSEGADILQSLDELITISRQSGARAEVYHLKVAGAQNWPKMSAVIDHIEAARAAGLQITADMYTYPASGTGLNVCIPPWAREEGATGLRKLMRDRATLARLLHEIEFGSNGWENNYVNAGPSNIMFVGFRNAELRRYTGRRLDAIAAERGISAPRAILDLLVADDSRIETIYFMMSEENLRRQISLPWVSFASDAIASSTDHPAFAKVSSHPREYGNFARVFAKYVRAEKVLTIEAAVRKLAALPAENLRLRDRGRLEVGYYADVAVFDPAIFADTATFERPKQYAVGMRHVVVNGQLALENGEPTGALAGRAVRGPGWRDHPKPQSKL